MSNQCKFINLRSNNELCNKPCKEDFCQAHMLLLKKHNGTMTFHFCPFCGKINRSKYGVCYKCYYNKHIHYFKFKSPSGSNIPEEIPTITYTLFN